jgi:hypothetical protein
MYGRKGFYSAGARKSHPDHRTPKGLEAECDHTSSVGEARSKLKESGEYKLGINMGARSPFSQQGGSLIG